MTSRLKCSLAILFLFAGVSSSSAPGEALNVNVQNFSQHTGYIPIRDSYGARLFYFFFESRGSKNDPVVLYLAGGPGVGVAKALFNENGPFHINDDLSLKWNDFGWDKVCNLLYVDQPTGTGFSYSPDHRDIRINSKQVSKDLYNFLQAFFETRPEFLENDFYITGASYSGHTIPLLASQLHTKNKENDGIHINLKGFAIANGNTNPEYKFSSIPDFIYANKIISRSSYKMLRKINRECVTLIQRCQTDDKVCRDAIFCGQSILNQIRNKTNTYLYDIRQPNHPVSYHFSIMEKFLDMDHVRRAIGVGNKTYVIRSLEISHAMINDLAKSYMGVIPQLLEDDIKVLIFNGEYDLMCNWIGNLRWIESMKWSGHNQFLKIKLTSYKINGKKVGKFKNIGPLTFIKVFDAGHGVLSDQPYVSQQILANWMNS